MTKKIPAKKLPEQQRLRRARMFLTSFGIFFALVAIVIGIGSIAPSLALLICAAVSIVSMLLSRFASDRLVLRFEGLLTGWP